MLFLFIIEWVRKNPVFQSFLWAGSILLAAVFAIARVKKQTRKEVAGEQAREALRSVEERNDVEETVDRLPDGDALQRLRNEFRRAPTG